MEDFKKELEENISNLPGVKILKESGLSFKLIGGAIVSAMDGTVPKDYDLMYRSTDKCDNFSYMSGKGFNLICVTSNAYTYEKEGLTFQFIKTDINSFDYTISQCYYYSGREIELKGDFYNLKNKNLIPVHTKKLEEKFNQLLRLPHYQAKGFKIHPNTFRSLVESIWLQVRPEEIKIKYES